MSKIFISSSSEETKYEDLDCQRVDFEREAETNAMRNWINKYADVTARFEHDFPKNTTTVLTSVHTFKDTWNGNSSGAPCMIVYNSFNYTQDVKYETRLLELPTSGDFKLIWLVPNETDVLSDLFSKLSNDGLEAASNCIQPMFTTISRLESPSINFSSKIIRDQICLTKSFTGLHYGNLKVSNVGIYLNVLTCLNSYANSTPKEREEASSPNEQHRSFFFGLVFKDTPIFIGQLYTQCVKTLLIMLLIHYYLNSKILTFLCCVFISCEKIS